MKTFKTLTVALVMVLSTSVFASEGHDHGPGGHSHDAPATVRAKKGGQVKAIESIIVEVVAKAKDIKIYVFDKEGNAKDPMAYKISATAELPRGKGKAEAVTLTKVEDALQGTFDAKSSHRYTLILSVTDPEHGHADKLKFNIENKK